MLEKTLKRLKRKSRVKASITSKTNSPRISIFRSNTNIYAQLIDDSKGITLCSSSDLKIAEGTKLERANKVGEEIAKKALDLKIKKITFDRGGFKYQGRVKALAEAARKAGLEF